MNAYRLIKTLPHQEEYNLFESVPRLLYPKNSPRFQLGHDPSMPFLEGCYVLLKKDIPVGRFAFYENPNRMHQNRKTCTVGSYECENKLETSKILLQHAKELAVSKGYSWIIGPMEGSTWESYRFSLTDCSNPFFMEPYHHLYYNSQFVNSGFEIIKEYCSNLVSVLQKDNKHLLHLENEYKENGFTLREIDLSKFELELEKIAKLSQLGFSSNFLFSPIDENYFIQKYKSLKHYLEAPLIWMIEDNQNQLQGFLFAVRDVLDTKNDTLIVKTIVKNKTSKLNNFGEFTIQKINEIARQEGCSKVIHAMMSKENVSWKQSKNKESKPHREYALYGMKL